MLPSCAIVGGILRLGVRGRLLNRAAYASRFSKKGTLSSFGRVGSTALQISRYYRLVRAANNLQKIGEVFEIESGEKAIEVNVSDKLSECLVDSVPIMTTRKDGDFLEHYSNVLQSSVGVSRPVSDSIIEHRDNFNVYIGSDVLEKKVILHYNENKELAGKTPLPDMNNLNTKNLLKIEEDAYLIKELAEIVETFKDDELIAVQNARKIMIEAQNKCTILTPTKNCDLLTFQAEKALKQLEDRFT